MAAAPPLPAQPRLRRHFHARPRLLISMAAGLVIGLLLPGSIDPTLRAVIGWDVAAALYLTLVVIMAARSTAPVLRRRAAAEDAARWAFLALMAGAAFFSMFAIFSLLHAAHGAGARVSIEFASLAAVTILLSWSFAHALFAVHYAHDYFGETHRKRPAGLAFPGDTPGSNAEPNYWDFLYFSFVIGMTAQVSDVQVTTSRSRRLVLAHGIMSFLFNTVILALSINLLAGLF